MWKHAARRGMAAVLAVGMSFGMVGAGKTDAAQNQNLDHIKGRTCVNRNVNIKESDIAPKQIILGDWDGNGVLELADVTNILRAALNLLAPTQWQSYVVSENDCIQLGDAQAALKTALNLQKESYIEVLDSTNMETVYEEVIERDWSMTLYDNTKVCRNKAEAQEYLASYPKGYEGLKQAVDSIPEEQTEGKCIFIYVRAVRADDKEQAGLEHIYKKRVEGMELCSIEIEDSSEVEGVKNYLYISVHLLPEEFCESEYWETDFIKNNRDVKANISTYCVEAVPSGNEKPLSSYEVITSVEEAQNFIKNFIPANDAVEPDEPGYDEVSLRGVLNKSDAYYEQYTHIVYRGSVPLPRGRKKLDWTVGQDELAVTLDCENWQMGERELDTDDTQGFVYYYVIVLKNDLIADKKLVFSASERTEDVSLQGEQKHFVLEPEGDYYYDFWFGIGNEEQRTDVLDKLGAKFNKPGQESYQELEEALKSADLEGYDVLVAFGINKTEESYQPGQTESVVAVAMDCGVDFSYSHRGMTFEPGKQIVSVLYVPKGSLEPYLSGYKNDVPYGEEDKVHRLMAITKIEMENKKVFLGTRSQMDWMNEECVIHVSDQTKITCNEKKYELEDLHVGDIVEVDYIDWIGGSPLILQGNSYIQLIYSKETGEAYRGLTAQQLQEKFPNNAYWNHPVLEDHDEESYVDTGRCNNPDGYTWEPCRLGKYGCNSYAATELCYGFAAKLADDVYGSTYYEWPWQENSIKNAKPGDVIFYYGNGATEEFGHRAMIIDINGTKLQLAECNWGAHCRISWGRWTDVTKFREYTLFVAPYELPGGGEGVLD